jgi:hypothetical protein
MSMEKSNTHTTLAGLYLASCIMITLWSCSKFPQLGVDILEKKPMGTNLVSAHLRSIFHNVLTFNKNKLYMNLEPKHGAQSSNLELGHNISLILMQIKLINKDTK